MLTLQKSLSTRSLVDSNGRRRVTCHGDGTLEINHQRVTHVVDRYGTNIQVDSGTPATGLCRILCNNELRYVFRNANGDSVGDWYASIPEERRVVSTRCSGRRTYRRETKYVPGIPFDEWVKLCAEATIRDPETEVEEVTPPATLSQEVLNQLYQQLLESSASYSRPVYRSPQMRPVDSYYFVDEPITRYEPLWTTTDDND